MSFLTKIFGNPNTKEVSQITDNVVNSVNSLEAAWARLSDQELKNKTVEFKDQLSQGKTLDDILVPAFATVREAAKRVINQRHFDVQLIGGYVLHHGQIAEMKTGEGKTLTSTLAIYLNALAGKGIHVVTVNDYLAKRDAAWMGQIYSFLGLTIGCLQNQTVSYLYDPENQSTNFLDRIKVCTRQEAYRADITYGTNNEFGFDYLRDNMVIQKQDMVQRDLYYAIVDEIDSILIDEARTPLIISAPAEESTDQYYRFAKLVTQLLPTADYNIDEKMRAATLTEEGITKMEKLLGVDNIYVEGGMSTVHHLEQALRAYTLFKRDRDYVVKDSEVIIVDEFTGRLMPGRRYSEGLHQAIEAQEGVEIKRESQTLATVTFQNYFRMYQKLAGMTGTAATEAEEFNKIYNLDVVDIPTNKPMVRQDLNDQIYRSEVGKFKAVAGEVKRIHDIGQPILIGTISIEKNEVLAELLEREGVPHQVLNAKHHEKEAQIIADAGKLGAVTLATNMAGRGV
ncbi:MAG: preprotein translocase subunit SecA, partial [Patescibacteria group bacterium]